jgi:citron Rho-interacting kinase
MKTENKEKDMLISQLKAHIFELEQHEKDYDNLNHKFRSLQNDAAILNEEKLRLEYELRQRTENLSKTVGDLRADNENLQLTLNEKMAMNKKLYNDNASLLKSLDIKSAENIELRERLSDFSVQDARLLDEKTALERMVRDLTDVKSTQKIEITKLLEDNRNLSKMLQDSDKQVKTLETERAKLYAKNDEFSFEIKNLNGKLKSKEENLNFNSRQLEENKSTQFKLTQTLKDYEKQIESQKNDLNNLNFSLQKERSLRLDAEKTIEHLNVLLNDRDREINRLMSELDTSRVLNQRVTDEKLRSSSDNERLKNHIIILTEQNEKVSNLISSMPILFNISNSIKLNSLFTIVNC